MARQAGFLDKLVARLERLDTASLQAQFLNLAKERGLLETIFQSIQEGVLVVTGDGVLQYANHAAETLLGIDASRLRGRSIARFLPDVDWERLARQDEEEWARIASSEVEVSYPTHRILSFYAVPLPGQGGEDVPGVVAMLRDITGDREQEATLVESERLSAVRYLAASVAHEIGNPLNALGIHLQLLDREVRRLPEENREAFRELVTVARDEVSRLDLIISQFLGALRPAVPDLVKGDLSDVLQETLRVMKTEIENRCIEVAVAHPQALPEVFIDRGQMKQVFFNIIKNALQAMPDGGRLTVKFEADERHLTVSLRDTGTGIPEESFRRIFEPYRTTKAKGHGLGLMIVQRIVQEHGGQVEVASKPGAGTVFRIVLPLADRRIRLLSERGGVRSAPAAKAASSSAEIEEVEHV
jgi:PAS domain S-box-containing protein